MKKNLVLIIIILLSLFNINKLVAEENIKDKIVEEDPKKKLDDSVKDQTKTAENKLLQEKDHSEKQKQEHPEERLKDVPKKSEKFDEVNTPETEDHQNSTQHTNLNRRVAVLDFKTNGVPSFVGRAISDIIVSELKKYQDIEIIDKQLFSQLKNEAVEENDLESVKKYATLMKVDKVIYGSISKIGDKYYLNFMHASNSTSSIQYVEKETFYDLDDIESASIYLSVKILNRITKKNYYLPRRKYKRKKDNNYSFDLIFSFRHSVYFNYNYPKMVVPSRYPEEIKLGNEQNRIFFKEFLFTNRYNINNNFGINFSFIFAFSHNDKGVGEHYYYKQSGNPDGYQNITVNKNGGSDSTSFYGFGGGLGLYSQCRLGDLKPFVSFNLHYIRYTANLNSFRVVFYKDNSFPGDKSYEVSIDNSARVLNAEVETGFLVNNPSVDFKFSVGFSKALYGSIMQKADLQLKHGSEAKSLPNEHDPKPPLKYFVEIGFVKKI